MVGLLSPSDYAGYADEGRRLAVDVPNVTPMDAARFIAEATPIIGDAMAAKEIYDEATSENPNWAMVGALGGAAVLGLFPGIGDAAAKAVKSGARGLLDTAKRVEVDPDAMGSLLGNVRLKPKVDATQTGLTFKDVDNSLNRLTTKADNRRISGDTSRVEEVPIRQLYATQPTVNPDFATTSSSSGELPLVVRKNGKMFVQDGHHRLTKKAQSGSQTAKVRFIDLDNADTSTPLLDWSPEKTGFVEADNDLLDALFDTSPAQEVSGLLASGRANEVTDEMLGKLTPNDNMELFELYQSGATGMDLPMDEASRMARAEAMFPRDGYHGTNADIKGFQGNVFSSDNPTLSSTYARGSADAQIYPLRLGSKLGDTVVEGGGVNWSQLDIGDVKDPAVAEWLDWAEGQKISTREIEQAAIREGRSGVQFKDINDTGPGFNSNQFKNLGYTKEQERALQKQYMEDLSKPSNVDVRLSPNLVRSKFARFDPRLSHLKDLSAAMASVPGGLLALQEMQKRANEEQQRQGLLQ